MSNPHPSCRQRRRDLHHTAASGLLAALLLPGCAGSPLEPAAQGQVTTRRGQLVASMVAPGYDPEQHAATCKVYHHVYAPDGRLLTKGEGGDYDHHRGLFLGWNQLNWRGRSYDFWHCRRGEKQLFQGFVAAAELGLSRDWQVANIHWRTGDDELVLTEHRALRARELVGGSIALDLLVELRATSTPVRLQGDPQHSGQQFRAVQEFAAADGPKVRYLRPANARGERDDVWHGCDWIAAILPLPDGEVTVLRLEGERNPRPVTWSTRAYGRFGATFAVELTPNLPLRLRWTYVLASGARDEAFGSAMAATQLPR